MPPPNTRSISPKVVDTRAIEEISISGMADQRHIADDVRKQLVDNHAVGEALGQYCDIEGKLIYSTNNIGLSLPDVVKVPNVIAVAGGQEKASAIIGVMRACQKGILIIDEQAAEGMRQLLQISAL